MAWSTRELAELAGTTVNTVRHYHRLGILEEPDREYNGYKQYGVQDLVRLLRIRRLAELGVPLSQIGDVGEDAEQDRDALIALDKELAESMKRLRKARSDISAILRESSRADAPAGFESVSARLSEADSSMLHIFSRIYDDRMMDDVRKMVESDPIELTEDIDGLSPDADEETRRGLAERLAPVLAKSLVEYPWLSNPALPLEKQGRRQETFVEAVVGLYNPAQLDVFHRASILATESIKEESGSAEISESEASDGTDPES